MKIDGLDAARQLVRQRFPHARAAWLGGSVAHGTATATSDLDITVLVAGPPAPYSESLRHRQWPVELFVQTETSIEHFCAQERAARRPTTLRLIGQAHILIDTDGIGARLRERCTKQLAEGPRPLTGKELEAARYRVTDLLDDLAGAQNDDERLLIASTVWQATADLLLAGHSRWSGGGKWLQRELVAFDRDAGTSHARMLAQGMRSAAAGAVEPMAEAVTEALDLFGGPLFHGFKAAGPA